jgi:hypothetical protein
VTLGCLSSAHRLAAWHDSLLGMIRALILFLFASIVFLSGVQSVVAQPAVYVSGAAFADIKQFDSVEYDPFVLASGDDFSLDATGLGGGIRVGTFLHPRWSLELAVDAGTRTTKELTNPYTILGSSSALRVPELSASTQFLTVSTVLGFHPAKRGRVHLGYLGGFSFVRGTHESALPDFRILTTGTSTSRTSGLGSLFPVTFPPIDFGSRTLKLVDNSAGGILGVEAAIDLTTRLAAVPGVRAVVFSTRGRGVFLIRPEVGVRWNF